MSLIVVDVESDGPAPGLYSMVSFGAVVVDHKLDKTFYGETAPISDKWVPEALAVSDISREVHEGYNDPKEVMVSFFDWIMENSKGRPVFISDNNGFDWQFINYYFHKYVDENPFGFSSRRIGDLYCGLEKDMGANKKWKRFRKTKHTHNPVDDAKGNAEALLKMRKMGLYFKI
jgi:DNA polymerase III epsilon subunit-like protein